MNRVFSVARNLAIPLAFSMGMGASVMAAPVVVIPLGGDNLNAVWAQKDGDNPGKAITSSSNIKINSIDINAPRDGFLVISGFVYVNSYTIGERTYKLIPQIDDIDVASTLPVGWLGLVKLDNTVGSIEAGTISYTITTQITKGEHTVSQILDPGSDDFFYNNEQLTTMYFPVGSLEEKNTGLAAALSKSQQNIDAAGYPIAQ